MKYTIIGAFLSIISINVYYYKNAYTDFVKFLDFEEGYTEERDSQGEKDENMELIYTFEITRHGARAP